MTYLAAAFSTFLLILALRPLARKINLVAEPGDHRQHQLVTPLIGGLAMYLIIVVFNFLLNGVIPVAVMIAATLVVFFGLIDDRWTTPFWLRFAIQIASAFIVIQYHNITLDHLGFLVSDELFTLGGWNTGLTVFAMVGVINAVNMIDGMDGLAGSLVVVCLAAVVYTIAENQIESMVVVCALLISVVIGFLALNLRLATHTQASIFMGDAGSTLLGLFVAWILVEQSQRPDSQLPPVLALWFLAIPLFDTVGVMVRRLIRGRVPFKADSLHTHHLLQKLGLTVNQSLMVLVFLSALFVVVAMASYRLGMQESTLFFSFLLLFIVYLIVMELGHFYVRR